VGILSSEQYDEMVSKMEAVASGEEQPVVEAQADESPQSNDSQDSNQAEDGSSSDTEDVKEEVETQGDDSEPQSLKVPESVPYGRFREVNEKFRSRERDLEYAQQRIRDLEQMTLKQAEKPKADKSADEWLDELLDSGESKDNAQLAALRNEIQSVKSWQQQRTEQLVAKELEAEIATAIKDNPEVSKQELWQAVAADGSVDIASAAAGFQKAREEMRSKYTAEAMKEVELLKAKLEEAEKAATEAKAFRRPGSSAPAPSSHSEGQRPRTVSEATAAFAEAIRERHAL
tara:strand:- start:490 stop:1353 length:864 start_codon:yes stop_codon:yes gene_type:complete